LLLNKVCVDVVGFTPVVNDGILSLKKDRRPSSPFPVSCRDGVLFAGKPVVEAERVFDEAAACL